MANVTDPLARAVHGTNPQNLIEYITRQKIYDSRYWKEECFGLNATDIIEKAAKLTNVGGSYGGNMKPSYFLCLALKMLQIQLSDDIVEELVQNEDLKYVRALGAFYLRLTGRPKDIYELLEPLYNDYRKLRVRTITDWNIQLMDEFVDELLRNDFVCGIALPRLPKRAHLEEAGYLEPRKSALGDADTAEQYLIELARKGSEAAKQALIMRGVDSQDKKEEGSVVDDDDGNKDQGDVNTNEEGEDLNPNPTEGSQDNEIIRKRSRSRSRSWGRRTRDRDGHRDRGYDSSDRLERRREDYDDRHRHRDHRSRGYDDERYRDDHRHERRVRDDKSRRSRDDRREYPKDRKRHRRDRHSDRDMDDHRYDKDYDDTSKSKNSRERESGRSSRHEERRSKKKDRKDTKYGSLFKDKSKKDDKIGSKDTASADGEIAQEGSDEYWNEQRAKLGLKPLKN